jgi:hypothetical protein
MPSPNWPPPSNTTPRARRCSRRWIVAFAKAKRSAPSRRPSSSPSPAHAGYLLRCWRTARFGDGIVLFNGTNTDDGSKRSTTRLAQTPRGHRPHHRLQLRRHALGAGRALPRAGPHHDRHRGRRRRHQPPVLLAGHQLRPALEPAAHRAAHRPLPSLRAEARRGGGQFPQPQATPPTSACSSCCRKSSSSSKASSAPATKCWAPSSPASISRSASPPSTRTAASPRRSSPAFDQLQLELSLEINESMTRTRQQLLENFDDEVREKLKVRDDRPGQVAGPASRRNSFRLRSPRRQDLRAGAPGRSTRLADAILVHG